MHYLAFPCGVQGVVKGGAIVPFKVIEEIPKLFLYDVEVPAIGPVIPQIISLEFATGVHEEEGVELVGPWSWCGVH